MSGLRRGLEVASVEETSLQDLILKHGKDVNPSCFALGQSFTFVPDAELEAKEAFFRCAHCGGFTLLGDEELPLWEIEEGKLKNGPFCEPCVAPTSEGSASYIGARVSGLEEACILVRLLLNTVKPDGEGGS
jgi:hypothetical protein